MKMRRKVASFVWLVITLMRINFVRNFNQKTAKTITINQSSTLIKSILSFIGILRASAALSAKNQK